MYICYVDESGHNGQRFNPRQPVEVVCGVLTDVTKLFKTQKELALIMRFLHKKGIPLSELKASDAYRGRNHWAGVTPKLRDKIFEMVIHWAEERSCKFIACPIDTQRFFEQKAAGCITSNQLGYPYEAGALNVILAIERLHKSKRNNKGKTFIIFDEQHGHDNNLLKILEGDLSFTDEYTTYTIRPRARYQEPRLSQIVDVPHFSKSHLSVLIQIADWIAFIVNTYLLLTVYACPEKYPGELAKIETWYRRIGGSLVAHTAIDPTGRTGLPAYYRSMRPADWSARRWTV